MVLLAINLSSLCQQIEGESEVTTIIIKKPENSRSGSDDLNDKNINDISPPEIKIISPGVDTSFIAQISASNIYLIGRLTDQSGIQSLLINDSIIATDENGFFQQKYNLVNGLNVFKIDATDKLSHSCTKLLSLVNNTTDVAPVNADESIFKGINLMC